MITALPHYLGKLPLIWVDAVLLCCGSGWFQYCRSMAHDEPMKCRPGSPGAPPLSPAQILRTCSHFRTPKPLSANLKEDLGEKRLTSATSMFSIYFSITCGWNMTWSTVDSTHLPNVISSSCGGADCMPKKTC